MWRLDLDLIAPPSILAQRLEIAHKIPSSGVDLAELRDVLGEGIAERDAPVACGEGYQPLEGAW